MLRCRRAARHMAATLRLLERGARTGVMLAAAAMTVPAGAQALTFGQAFEAAVLHDPTYRAAEHERNAIRMEEPIARSALLPVVTLNASTADVEGTRSFPNAINQDVRTRLNYQSPQASINVRLPLLNFEGRAGLAQAQAQVAAAEEQFLIDRRDLVDRLAEAYFQLLAAQDTARLLERQVDALEIQRSQAQRRFERGEGTRVLVAKAQAALEVGRSRAIEANNLLAVARQAMVRITGASEPSVPALPEALLPVPLQPSELAAWLEFAKLNSPTLRQRAQVLEAARATVRRRYAGHLPRLDAVGSVSRQESDSISNIGQTATLRSIGVQLTVPIFNGGGVDASVRQAKSRQMQAEEDLRLEEETIVLEVTRLWQLNRSGEARVLGLSETMKSSTLALRGAERSLEEGVGTAADASEIRSAALEIERQLLQARVDHVRTRVRLQLAAGVPAAEVVGGMQRMWLPAVAASDVGARP